MKYEKLIELFKCMMPIVQIITRPGSSSIYRSIF